MTNLLYRNSVGTANGQWSYGYDRRDFVTRRTDPSANNYSYRYDEAGRLVEALGTQSGANVSGYPFCYGFDRVGNRTRQVEDGKVRRLTYNVNNQLVSLARTNEVFVSGSVNEAGTGTVVQVKSDSMTNWVKVATRYICQTQAWFETSSVVVTNLGTNTVWIQATDRSGNSSTQTIHVVNSRTNAVFGYDLDGNQTNNLVGTYTWDAENRLVRVDYGTNGSTRLAFDGIGRLREVAEYGTGASPTNVVRYVWNGWLPWAELDASNRVQRTFTWGLDFSSTVGGAGGIGGLMGMRDYAGAGTNYQVRTDGKGNVTEIRRGSDALVVATYAYAPFGAVLSNSGSYNQPFKFQTKLSQTRSGIGYWGYRWYDYKTGRWLGRDKIGEAGGLNLYGYCGGEPLSAIDSLGLAANTISMNMPGLGSQDYEVSYYGPGGVHGVRGAGLGSYARGAAVSMGAGAGIGGAAVFGHYAVAGSIYAAYYVGAMTPLAGLINTATLNNNGIMWRGPTVTQISSAIANNPQLAAFWGGFFPDASPLPNFSGGPGLAGWINYISQLAAYSLGNYLSPPEWNPSQPYDSQSGNGVNPCK